MSATEEQIIEESNKADLKSSIAQGGQIGLIPAKCFDNGITNINEIADVVEAARQIQIKNDTWCYENFTELSSDSVATMQSHATNISKSCIVWSINHYLGLNRHPYVIDSAIQALQNFGSGCGTSAMSGGHNSLHKTLEKRLANVMGKESAILFPTGYSANLGAIAGIAKMGNSAIIFDRESHASIIDGIKLSGGKLIPFRHNDANDLERKIKFAQGKFDNILVVVESVYSMTGEEAPLAAIASLKDKYSFYLFVDEAHAFGLYSVGGLCKHLGLSDKVDFVMTTLSKSTASIGGVIATSRNFVSLLQIQANAYLFQAALTPPDAAAIIASLDLIENSPEIVASLWEKTAYFRRTLKDFGFDIGSGKSPIVPFYIRDSETLMAMGRDMLENGVFTTSVAYPVVKHTEVRFRFILNNSHTYDQINFTIEVLKKLGAKYSLQKEERRADLVEEVV